jgi:hypothetical protein
MGDDKAILDEDGKVILCDVDYLMYYGQDDDDDEFIDYDGDDASTWPGANYRDDDEV